MKAFKSSPSESNAGVYLGIAGVALSLIGVLLSVYSLSAGEKAIWLGVSGWFSALLVGIFLSIALSKLMIEVSQVHAVNLELSLKLYDLESANAKMIEIDAYVISKAVRQQATKRERKPADLHPQNTSNSHAGLDLAEES